MLFIKQLCIESSNSDKKMIVKHVDSRNRIPQIEYQVRYLEYEFFSFLLDSLVFHEDVLAESSVVVVQEWESMEESQ